MPKSSHRPAASTNPSEQHEPSPFINQRVRPSTSQPSSIRRAADSELSTPPERPTIIFLVFRFIIDRGTVL